MARVRAGAARRFLQCVDALLFWTYGHAAALLLSLLTLRQRIAQRLFFGRALPLTRALVAVVRAYFGSDIRTLAPEFETDFYLSQIPDEPGRASAASDPILHYLMLGHYVGLSPNRAFEPRYYRERNPKLSLFTPPFLDYLRRGRSWGEFPNHLAARVLAERRTTSRSAGAALVIDHPRGGGSTRYLNIYEQRLRDEGYRVIRGRRVNGGRPLMVFGEPAETACFDPFADEDAFVAFAKRAGVKRLVINHMVDLPGVPLDWARTAAARLGITYEVILHDYYLLCPRITLVDRHGRYCGVGDATACAGCLAQGEHKDIDIAAWRETSGRLLAGASRVVAPSEDLAARIQARVPRLEVEVFEPERAAARPHRIQRALKPGERLRVVMLGALDEAKGFSVIADLAKWVRATGAPIQLIVIGDTSGTPQLRNLGVRVTGRYQEADAAAILDRLSPDVFFFPAIWPETWSFTLTTALARGTPIVAFDIGAIAQRLRRTGTGVLLPYDMHRDAPRLGRWLIEFRRELSRCQNLQITAGEAPIAEVPLT